MRIAWHGMYPEEDKFVLNCLCLSESNKISCARFGRS